MAKNRAPVFVVAVATALPMAERHIRHMMCIDRSFVFDDVHVTQTETRNVANYRQVSVSPAQSAG
jgi:hypothetical protein